jgi:hypothetical protein
MKIEASIFLFGALTKSMLNTDDIPNMDPGGFKIKNHPFLTWLCSNVLD